MKTDSGEAEEERSTAPGSVQQEVRICPTCGTKFFITADRGFCPVCILPAAASVRHPNVASVLHLGRTGSSYFYAMEFVEGETLEHLIKRSGRVEVKLALEILALKAEALHLADRTSEALEAIREAEGLIERFEERLWRADLQRLRGALLTAIGADETQIEASFCEAIRTAREQKSIPLARRAEASYAEYRSKKGSNSS